MSPEHEQTARWLGNLAWVATAIGSYPWLHTWYVTVRLYGRMPWREVGQMLGLAVQTRLVRHLALALTPVAAIGGFALVGVYFPVSLASWALIWPLFVLWTLAVPPAILLLGTSRTGTVNLREDLERGLYPYRVVVLFDDAAVTAEHSFLERTNFSFDNLRTSDRSWRAVVHALMDLVPFIVVDTRIPSPAVVEEIGRIVPSALRNKTLFLVGPARECPALTMAGCAADPVRMTISSEANLVPLLKDLGLTEATSPDDVWGKPDSGPRNLRHARTIILSLGIPFVPGRVVVESTALQNNPRVREAHSLIDTVIAPNPTPDRHHAVAYRDRGFLLRLVNDWGPAETALRASRDILIQLGGAEATDREVLLDYRETMFLLGELAHVQERWEEAETAYEAGRQTNDRLGPVDRGNGPPFAELLAEVRAHIASAG